MASIVYEGAARRSEGESELFHGMKVWLSRQVPMRERYRNMIESHGGTIAALDKDATLLIVDHARRNNPPESFSYKYIEESIKNGALENVEAYRAGAPKGTVRGVGDTSMSTKPGKTAYTKNDDCMLWDWITPHLSGGGTDGGNEIYKQLELQNPRHTYQSWRDRWLKHLKGRPRPRPSAEEPARADTTTTTAQTPLEHSAPPPNAEQSILPPSNQTAETQSQDIETTDTDLLKLWQEADAIEDLDPDRLHEAWHAWATVPGNEHHSGEVWKAIWEQQVRLPWLRERPSSSPSRIFNLTSQQHEEASGEPQHAVSSNKLETVRLPDSPSHKIMANSSRRLTGSKSNSQPSQESEKSLNEPTSETAQKRKRDQGNPETLFLPREELAVARKRQRSALVEVHTTEMPVELRSEIVDNTTSEDETGSETDTSQVPKSGSTIPLIPNDVKQSSDQQQRRVDAQLWSSMEQGSQESTAAAEDRQIQEADYDELFQAPSQDHRFAFDGSQPTPTPDSREPRDSSVGETRQLNVEPDTHAILRSSNPGLELQMSRPEIDPGNIPLPSSPPSVQQDIPTSSFTTTPPGATAHPVPISSLPKRRNQLTSSSPLSTTTPGNTAKAAVSSLETPKPPFMQRNSSRSASRPTIVYQPEIDSDEEEEPELETWVEKQVAAGHDFDQIYVALKSTCLYVPRARTALHYLEQTGQLPQKMAGIWTEQDDKNLLDSDAGRIEQVLKKHGKDLTDERIRWLNE